MKLSELIEPINLLETFETRFSNKLIWTPHSNNLETVGELNSEKIKLILNPVTYKNFNGVNVIFQIYDETTNSFTEKIGASKNSPSKVIGAVINGLAPTLDEFDFDFIIGVAKDNLDSRTKLYSSIFRRIAVQKHLGALTIKRDAFTISGIGKNGKLDEILQNVDF